MQGNRPGGGADADAQVSRMIAAQRHRGPDDQGLLRVGGSGGALGTTSLGHCRLAILDPSPAGRQPMVDPRTGNAVVLNGEIYNHRALRADLGEAAGPWCSGSDTETLLHAYAAWGEACLERLRGMFAFALWDARRGVLWCARDRLGIKPLYVREDEEGVALASEVRALSASRSRGDRVDRAALRGYLRFGCVQDPEGLVAGVRSVPAGHAITVKGGRVERSDSWWDLRRALAAGAATDLDADLDSALERAVTEHLESDVPVAFLLSGGLDSSLLAALAVRARGTGFPAFTVAWDDRSLDETHHAAEVAKHLGLQHHVVRLSDEEACSEVMRSVQAQDLPSIDGANTWLVARAVAAQGIKVAVSGLGGDELFGGYPSFRWVKRAERWAFLLGRLPAWGRRLLWGRARADRAAALFAVGASTAKRHAALRSLWGETDLFRALPGFHGEDTAASAPTPAGLPPHVEIGVLETERYMRSMLLRDSDAMGMAHGLEIRLPFLDHVLVERALREAMRGSAADMDDKQRLRTAARDLLPPSILKRRKQGFVLPMERWMRGPLQAFVIEGMDALRGTDLVAEPFVAEVLAGFRANRLAWSRPWQLAVLGHWSRRCLSALRSAA